MCRTTTYTFELQPNVLAHSKKLSFALPNKMNVYLLNDEPFTKIFTIVTVVVNNTTISTSEMRTFFLSLI